MFPFLSTSNSETASSGVLNPSGAFVSQTSYLPGANFSQKNLPFLSDVTSYPSTFVAAPIVGFFLSSNVAPASGLPIPFEEPTGFPLA